MQYAIGKGFGSIPSATGGIARLARARRWKRPARIARRPVEGGSDAEVVGIPRPGCRSGTHDQAAGSGRRGAAGRTCWAPPGARFDLREIGLTYHIMASSEQLATRSKRRAVQRI